MKNVALQEAFEIEINKLDDNLTKPTSSIQISSGRLVTLL